MLTSLPRMALSVSAACSGLWLLKERRLLLFPPTSPADETNRGKFMEVTELLPGHQAFLGDGRRVFVV
ncbi:hypothetical protein Pmani_021758 [Petrolisthes manimaculis]|uniref:Uncharacterized protein n=1 Tax=Petrolisthes manimaculis TaxID=1843537 RepID=A0AAE1PF66_9EUCA|nr:hypothetical protein Pmani_021758 [Petrolisthes manimaculis]